MSPLPTTVIDVRTPAEFADGHVAGSINIPLNELPERVAEIKAISGPIVLCCRSGARSENATHYLRQLGITDVRNGGPWQTVQNELER